MKSLLELEQFDLESASQQQVAALVQALLEQVKKAASELQSKDEKIQALTYELAYLRRIRYGVKKRNLLANCKRICCRYLERGCRRC